MRALGIEHVVPDDADVSVVVAVVRESVEPPHRAGTARTARVFGDPATSMALPPGAGTPVAPEQPARDGSVIAVWGPTGAPGRTTVAVTLADELARLGAHTLLVDADVYGGTVAAALGLLDESPGLAAACRQAAATRLDAAALAAACWQLDPDAARADRPADRVAVARAAPAGRRRPCSAAARQLADFTVLDCGFCLETDEEISFDTLAPRRNGATLAVLDAADVVLVVGAADPIGMQRLVRALAELRDAEIAAPVWVVLNKVRRGAVPGDPAVELAAALEQFAGRTPAALLPYDRESLDAALATGRSLGEQRPASPLRKAVVELAGDAVRAPGPGAPQTRVDATGRGRSVTMRDARPAAGRRRNDVDDRATLAGRRRVLLPRDAHDAAARRRASGLRAAARRLRLRPPGAADRGADLAGAALPAADALRARRPGEPGLGGRPGLRHRLPRAPLGAALSRARDEQLLEFCARIQSRLLDRSRPLWEMYLVEGLADGRVAIVTKTHHSMVDGHRRRRHRPGAAGRVAGAAPHGRGAVDARARADERAAGGRRARRAARRPAALADAVRLVGPRCAVGGALADRDARARRGSVLSGLVRPAPAVTAHAPVLGEHRRIAVARTGLDDFRLVRAAHGGTVNDVVLATVAGAPAQLAARPRRERCGRRRRCARSCRWACAARTTRSAAERSGRVTGVLVDLPVGDADPAGRLARITAQARRQRAQPGTGRCRRARRR